MYIKHSLEYGSDFNNNLAETSELIQDPYDIKQNNDKKSYFNYVLNTLIFIGVIVTTIAVVKVYSTAGNSQSSKVYTKKESNGLTVEVSNEYGVQSSVAFPYSWLEGNLFAETYKTNTFTIQSTTDGCTYNWAISGVSSQLNDYYSEGSSDDGVFTFTPTITGEYGISISEYCDNSLTRSYASSVFSKYVRRELLALTDSDREAFLDTFAKLWTIKTPEGQALYGENYKSLWYFAIVHNDASANPVCDEFHTGSGFTINHVLLGSYLEQSMRLINPSVSLHYMEYANYYDSDAYSNHLLQNMLDGGAWSEIFTDKWFGSNDPYTGKILDGRWANIDLPYVTDEFIASEGLDPSTPMFSAEAEEWLEMTGGIAHMSSPYGLLRSPWNWSPAPYTLRYNNVNQFNSYEKYLDLQVNVGQYMNYYTGVVCADYKTFMYESVNGKSMYDLLRGIEDDVHGKIHFTVGGSGGTKVVETIQLIKDKFGFDDMDMVCIAQSSQKYFKTMFERMPGYDINENDGPFPLDCTPFPWQNQVLTSTLAPGEDGGPTCQLSSYYKESIDNLQIFKNDFFIDWTDGVPQYSTVEKVNNLSFEDQVDLINTICGQFQFDGDMGGSGAASDPIFWVVHESVERLMQKIYFEDTLADHVYVGDEYCSGHAAGGTKDWLKGFYFEDASLAAETLTNAQLVQFLNPTTDDYRDNINYVFDHSDWDTTMCKGVSKTWFDSSNFDVTLTAN